ncbi:hypothetical protein [Streptomyces sp. NPDC020965]|uniref:hypothetical protein n=1 Tax=Streptomyces sp. NPDC020965 TaxID=3365105 RepID=UPI0037AEFB1D
MSQQADLATIQQRLDELVRRVGELERTVDRLSGTGTGTPSRGGSAAPPAERPDLIIIPDAPYDTTLWTDSDDEGLGVRDRHAP